MKTFNDLVFEVRKEFDGSGSIFEGKTCIHARMDFESGYGISVLLGSMFYSNGFDTYEVGIMYNGKITYNTPITDDVIGYQTADQVTEIMRQIQEL